MQKLFTFFSKNINVYIIVNDQSFNDTLTNDIVSFEQLDPGLKLQRSDNPPNGVDLCINLFSLYTNEHRGKIFHILILRNDMSTAVCLRAS